MTTEKTTNPNEISETKGNIILEDNIDPMHLVIGDRAAQKLIEFEVEL
ncbi:MAG: hypothetical protein AAGC79_16360 [Pseudomonadota bacterium]